MAFVWDGISYKVWPCNINDTTNEVMQINFCLSSSSSSTSVSSSSSSSSSSLSSSSSSSSSSISSSSSSSSSSLSVSSSSSSSSSSLSSSSSSSFSNSCAPCTFLNGNDDFDESLGVPNVHRWEVAQDPTYYGGGSPDTDGSNPPFINGIGALEWEGHSQNAVYHGTDTGQETYRIVSRWCIPAGQDGWSIECQWDFSELNTANAGTNGHLYRPFAFGVAADPYTFGSTRYQITIDQSAWSPFFNNQWTITAYGGGNTNYSDATTPSVAQMLPIRMRVRRFSTGVGTAKTAYAFGGPDSWYGQWVNSAGAGGGTLPPTPGTLEVNPGYGITLEHSDLVDMFVYFEFSTDLQGQNISEADVRETVNYFLIVSGCMCCVSSSSSSSTSDSSSSSSNSSCSTTLSGGLALPLFDQQNSIGDISVACNTLTFTNVGRNSTSYWGNDYGVDAFGDFEIRFEMAKSGIGSAVTENVFVCAVSNTLGDFNDGYLALDEIDCSIYSYTNISLADRNTGNSDTFASGTWWPLFGPWPTTYCTFKRSGSIATFDLYSDFARTILVDAMSITCEIGRKRYLYAFQARGDLTSPNYTMSGFTQNFQIITFG